MKLTADYKNLFHMGGGTRLEKALTQFSLDAMELIREQTKAEGVSVYVVDGRVYLEKIGTNVSYWTKRLDDAGFKRLSIKETFVHLPLSYYYFESFLEKLPCQQQP